MSIVFPRDLLAGLRFQSSTPVFEALWRQETSRTAGGVTLRRDLGPMLWRGHWLTMPMPNAAAEALEADLLSLGGGLRLFEGWDPRRYLPASDKVSALAGVTVSGLRSDRGALQLSGLPGGFVLTKGDWLSIDDGTNLHLHKVLETVTATSGGTVPLFEVMPAVRPGVSFGDSVALRYPSARWQIEDSGVQREARGPLYQTIAWSAVQVIL